MIRLILLSIILLFFYNYIHHILVNLTNEDLVKSIYNKKCVIKKFKKTLEDNNMIYKVNNFLLRSNIINPLLPYIIGDNSHRHIKKKYNKLINTEVYTFKDKGQTIIEYLNNNNNLTILFTDTINMSGIGDTYLKKIMIELYYKNYNCIFIYNRGYKIPINNNINHLSNILEDFTELINYVTSKNKKNKYFLFGGSFGANTFCKYLCHNNNSLIHGFISLCNPLDLLSLCMGQTNSFINNHIINIFFKRIIKNYIINNYGDNNEIKQRINILMKDLELFYTELIRPYSKKKYKNFKEYCYNISCINFIDNLKTPSLFITSKDDCVTPLNYNHIEKLKTNKYIYQLTTLNGSHIAHFTDDAEIWIIDVIDKFITYLN
jgi:predicted alpha/beta-fold hydrolase